MLEKRFYFNRPYEDDELYPIHILDEIKNAISLLSSKLNKKLTVKKIELQIKNPLEETIFSYSGGMTSLERKARFFFFYRVKKMEHDYLVVNGTITFLKTKYYLSRQLVPLEGTENTFLEKWVVCKESEVENV